MNQRMVLQCDRCPMRGTACDDCVVTAFFAGPQVEREEEMLPLDRDEWAAVGNLVRAGLVDPVSARQAQARRTPLRLARSVG